MNYKVRTIQPFDKQAKRYLKKYPSLKSELATLISELEQTPDIGTSIGHDCYKIRIAIASKGKGKSGGARVITCAVVKDAEVYLLYMYDKSEQSTVTDKELLKLLEYID
ncbi:hypothetical protein BEL04_18065 [Mucilaginibacter sp. PPCGB 2223]|uniref:type II toxin-antitoxin system RelE/ParE family toxin n=1 Tax=Mucilaginibacter sp. PPCGB 2223 TaxID=1886027 RepID=UPI00082502B6|nr:type II toxin-antitoxin system RelE/ParE family toxin [Mucilaginibacter sp. PPCGB 2223]OCX51908.1 hypothetical protein BEL04_18065 [Mucilaginibacter sp. PPCGB 2223]